MYSPLTDQRDSVNCDFPSVHVLAIVSCPSESSDTKVSDGSHPKSSYDVLGVIPVGMVDALSVERANLIMQEAMPVFPGVEQVSLNLYAHVASVA